MTTPLPPVDWPHRPEIGKFNMFNCFQEALAPVLKRDFGIEGTPFDQLRFIGLPDIAGPITDRLDPGGFGGLPWPRIGELYHIHWRWLRKVARDRPETVHALAQHGPLIAIVDRYHVPTDKVCHNTHHRMHTILVVSADADGIGYSDVEYPFNPAHISWEDFGRALLPAADRKLKPGPDEINSFVVLVEEATDLSPAARERVRRDFLAALGRSLDAGGERVDEVRKLVLDALGEVTNDPVNGQLRGQDIGALLNGAVRSLEVAASALEAGGDGATAGQDDAGAWVGELWRRADKANRLLQMYVESGREQYLDRTGRQLEQVVEAWDQPGRATARAVLLDG